MLPAAWYRGRRRHNCGFASGFPHPGSGPPPPPPPQDACKAMQPLRPGNVAPAPFVLVKGYSRTDGRPGCM